MRRIAKVLFIDDDEYNAKRYAARIERASKRKKTHFEVTVIQPTANLDLESVVDWEPDLTLIDLDLTNAGVAYEGETLASKINKIWPNVPRILTTRPNVLEENPDAMMRGILFDDRIFKADFRKKSSESVNLLISHVKAFREMRQQKEAGATWSAVAQLLGARKDEHRLFLDSSPPIQRSWSGEVSEDSLWNPHGLSRWVRTVLMFYPGVLYDPLYSASSLGITKRSFLMNQKFFEKARFTGLYHELSPRWWKGRLHEIAYSVIAKAGLPPVLAKSFAASSNKLGLAKLQQAKCVYSKKAPADTVCHLLEEQFKKRYTFEYYPDSRPDSMDVARVSYSAVRSSYDFDIENLREDDQMAAQILIDAARGAEETESGT